MKGFLLAGGMLFLTALACGGSFLSGNTGLALPMLLAFYGASLVTAFYAGRAVDLQSPFRPRDQTLTAYRRSRPVPTSTNGPAKNSLLSRVKPQPQTTDEFN